MEPIQRICVDLDTKDIDEVIRCLRLFKRYKFTKDLEIKLSSSKNGYHLISWHDDVGVSKKKLMQIRKKAGCDKIQLMLDSRTGRQIQVLSDTKHKRKYLKLDGKK